MSKARDLANSAAAFSAVSATELGYVDGVTSAIQTQLDAKAASSYRYQSTGLWSNTAAITSIKLQADLGNFVQYSTASLYGILKY